MSDTPWVQVENSGRTNTSELVASAMLTMPEELRERWTEALNANRFAMRYLEPDAALDVDDPSIPEERFEHWMQVFLTDGGEFSSVQWPLSAWGHYVDAEE